MDQGRSPEGQDSRAFLLLDERIQRWIYAERWDRLRDIQEIAIPPILECRQDVILAAATASGKTEAAFLPILTRLALLEAEKSVVIYISPLKALINDQWSRLTKLCETLEIPVFPWHGDIPAGRKKAFFKTNHGVILITPESLESLFVNQAQRIPLLSQRLGYVVVDELHAFIGSERGRQLQSLMHRLEVSARKRIPRIALSATLGNMKDAAEYLRPGDPDGVILAVSNDDTQELKIILKGYLNNPVHPGGTPEEIERAGDFSVADDLFRVLRGRNHLIFPNSRGRVEFYADLLRRRCEKLGVPNEFWPHHGSLSKEVREETESALKKGDLPATAICTVTLELGIDIGAVESIAQIGPPPSVTSLRQRLGRSGRRGGPAILRAYTIEEDYDPEGNISDQLREGLVQTIGVIELLLKGWYEPPDRERLHLSTLVQQLLSIICQHGGVTAQNAWTILCSSGPFHSVDQETFIKLLRALGKGDVLVQTSEGLLLPGEVGERISNHYSFYVAFMTEEEFRIISGNRTLGHLPISRPLEEGSSIIFAGRRWVVISVDAAKKTVCVRPSPAGRPPAFGGEAGAVHSRIRQEMRRIYQSEEIPLYLNISARELLTQARQCYRKFDLAHRRVISIGQETILFPWHGDYTQNTIELLLLSQDLDASNDGLTISIHDHDEREIKKILKNIGNSSITAISLASHVRNKIREKYDYLLTEELLCEEYAKMLDVDGAKSACREIADM